MRKDKLSGDNPIYEIRRALGLTQQDLAESLGCSLMTARRIEYGNKPKNKGVQHQLGRLAHQVNVELGEYLKG